MDFSLLTGVFDALPPTLRFNVVQALILVALFAIIWLLRKRIARLLVIPIRALTKRTGTKTDDFFFQSIDKFIDYVILSVPLLASIFFLSLTGTMAEIIRGIAFTLIVYAVFRFLFDLTSRLLVSADKVKRITGYEVKPALMPITSLTGRVLIIIIGLLSIAQIWGWNVAGLIAGVGLGGLAISLAAKDILDDILGYAVIVADNIFREGDYIASPSGEGIVEEIGVRSTKIRQLNQGLVTIPNAKLSDDWVTNWSRLEKRWFNFVVGITYKSTADKIESFVNTLTVRLKARDHVQDDSVVVLFTEYDASSLNVLIRCYVDLPDWVDAHVERHQVNLLIMETLTEVGLTVAFPSRSLYLDNVPDGLAQTLSAANHKASDNNTQQAAAHQVTQPGDDDATVREKESADEAEAVLE